MTVLFLIFFFDQFCPKWIKLDQTWSNWISSPIWRCYYEKLSHLQKGEKWLFCFWFFWIRSVQNGSNLIKLDQIGFLHQSKNVPIKNYHIYRKDKNGCFVFNFFGLDLSKMDQTWSKWISHQSKNVTLKNCHISEYKD